MKRRTPTQQADPHNPFLFSVVAGRGVVKNVSKPTRPRVKIEAPPPQAPPRGRVKINPIFTWNLAPAQEPQAKPARARSTLVDRVLPNGASVPRALFDDPPF